MGERTRLRSLQRVRVTDRKQGSRAIRKCRVSSRRFIDEPEQQPRLNFSTAKSRLSNSLEISTYKMSMSEYVERAGIRCPVYFNDSLSRRSEF